MLLIIEIETTSINTRAGTKEGRNWRIDSQPCLIHGLFFDGFPSRFPRESSVQVQQDQNGNGIPYPVGKYVMSAESFRLNQFGRFEMGRDVKLASLESAARALKDHLTPAAAPKAA